MPIRRRVRSLPRRLPSACPAAPAGAVRGLPRLPSGAWWTTGRVALASCARSRPVGCCGPAAGAEPAAAFRLPEAEPTAPQGGAAGHRRHRRRHRRRSHTPWRRSPACRRCRRRREKPWCRHPIRHWSRPRRRAACRASPSTAGSPAKCMPDPSIAAINEPGWRSSFSTSGSAGLPARLQFTVCRGQWCWRSTRMPPPREDWAARRPQSRPRDRCDDPAAGLRRQRRGCRTASTSRRRRCTREHAAPDPRPRSLHRLCRSSAVGRADLPEGAGRLGPLLQTLRERGLLFVDGPPRAVSRHWPSRAGRPGLPQARLDVAIDAADASDYRPPAGCAGRRCA